MNRKIFYVILAVVFVVGAVYIIWRAQQQEQSEQAFRSVMVERGAMLVEVSSSGSVKPAEQVDLAFQSVGRVTEVPVEMGDRVKEGDLLARLDGERLTLQAEQARAAVTSAEARLAQLRADAREEEIAVAEANVQASEAQVNAASANLVQLLGGAAEAEIAAAEADLASAQTRQKAAADAYEKTLRCVTVKLPYGQGKKKVCPALGPPEEQARYNLQAADKALAAAQAQLDELLAGADVDAIRAARANVAAAQAQRDAAQAQLDLLLAGATEGEIAAAEAQVEQARASLRLAELALERATLRAPFDGVVAAVNVVAGEMASAGLPAIAVLDTSTYHLAVQVDEIDVGRLGVGQEAQVTLDALPNVELTGRVERIAPAATMEGGVVYYDVTVGLEPGTAPVRADMTANVTIVVEELTDVLKIPTWVVRVDPVTGETYVNQREGGEIVRRDVALGVRHEGVAQVLDGLSEGDEAIWVPESGFGFGR